MDESNERRHLASAGGAASDSITAGEHVDELTAMRLADGDAVVESAATHAAGCRQCAELVAALRAEAQALLASLTLDAEDMAFLVGAALPARVRRARERRQRAAQLAMAVAALVVSYLGWLIVSATIGTGPELARRAGLTAAAARAAAGGTIAAAQSLWNAVVLAAQSPLLDAPALPLLAVAGALWIALWLASPHRDQGEPRPAQA